MSPNPPPATPAAKERGPLIGLALDFGPLAVFFLANVLTKNIFLATLVFMVATAAAMLAARIFHGKVSPMLAISGVMVLVFGGLTIWLHSETFIKLKPTIYYVMVAAILFFGLWTNRPTLKVVLGAAYPGLSDRGWSLLSRNWAWFFLVLAAANELVWRNTTTDFWLGYKLWGAMPATILFALANIPLLMKHGLDIKTAESDPPIPPQG
ncbi:septation protein A [Sphingomonas prati]|uniref:Inner membrane-spanning protein YciB n=1 Tax=Sphingomonas prati TaxID=1843237 RepID=A0A7W9BSV7_9SPHN|nr:septation protein A [Sphingomonas prati]MBB5729401.1 intracellular septation protein [Sphingomonas prati]GGE77694.1 putative intracellular septation protein A [Sphingomonas prati]